MSEQHIYNVTVHGHGPKTGLLGSPDPVPDLAVATPPQFDGPPGVWSPEHLFVASVASCLMTTFRAIAEMSGVEILDYEDAAAGILVEDPDGLYRMSEVRLRPKVTISDPRQVDRVTRLIEKAESVCLISRSIDTEVAVDPQVLVAATV